MRKTKNAQNKLGILFVLSTTSPNCIQLIDTKINISYQKKLNILQK